MTRYAIDPFVAIEIARGAVNVDAAHTLVGPGKLRSDALSMLYVGARNGALAEEDVQTMLGLLSALDVRIVDDGPTRRRAWDLARERGWDDTSKAEYLAVAALESDALIAYDEDLLAGAEGVTPVADLGELQR